LNSTARTAWIEQQVRYTEENGLDGVNFDFEEELEPGTQESKAYTKLFKETVPGQYR
jgi:spore germination protein YaaH